MTGKRKNSGSNMKKVDAHRIRPDEYEELPALTEAMLARGVWKKAGKPVGRPAKEDKKVSVHLRIDPEVRDAFRASGAGWQTRINALLRDHMPR
jgi:uncharacterized protein (DUF4415 family)